MPLPFLFPPFHCPSYVHPSAETYTPLPSLTSPTQSPVYLEWIVKQDKKKKKKWTKKKINKIDIFRRTALCGLRHTSTSFLPPSMDASQTSK
jgi:hypothetical protein